MPHVTVTVIGNAPTQEQKSALFSKISNLLVTVLGPARTLTLVSVRTEPAADWSVGGDKAEGAGLVGVEAVIRAVAGSSVENRARMIAETTTVLREVLGTPILPKEAPGSALRPLSFEKRAFCCQSPLPGLLAKGG